MMEQEEPAVRIKYVRVTNLGTVMFADRHNGVPLKIQPGETRNVPLEPAAHIFGWKPDVEPDVMFRHMQRRQGWNTPEYLAIDPESGLSKAQVQFCKLKIEPVLYKLVEVERDPSKPIAADPQPPEEPRPPRRVDVRA
jgi:hypothetical protein